MKKYKNKILLAISGLIVMSAYIFVTTWQSSTYKEVHAMYPIQKSKNPQASEEFLKAMEYRIYIKQLHPFFDYDSFIMAPLLEKLDYHFKKGKSLLPKDSVEDIVWWVLFYKEIYGLLGNSKNDDSLWYENLPYKEFRKVHDKVYEMIMRYPDGEVYFNIPEIEQFRFKTMAILVGFYYKNYSLRYDGKSKVDKAKKANMDVLSVNNLKVVQEKYKFIYKNFISLSKNKNFMKNEYLADQVSLSSKLIVKYVRINNTQDLPESICYSENVKFILQNTNDLLNFVKNKKNHQAYVINRLLFDENYSNVPIVMKLLDYECMNLRPKIGMINQKIEQYNKSRKQ